MAASFSIIRQMLKTKGEIMEKIAILQAMHCEWEFSHIVRQK